VVLPAAAVDENEDGGNNNNCSGSSVVTISQFGEHNGVIEAGGSDWWKIMHGAQGSVNIAFSCSSADVQFYVSSGSSLCDYSTSELHWGVGAGNGDVTLEAGRYYSIDINASNPDNSYNYTITITDNGGASFPDVPTVDENEDGGNNNTCGGSSVLTISQFGDYNGVIEAGDYDWWKIMHGAQGSVNIALSGSDADVDFYLYSDSSPCGTTNTELSWWDASDSDVTLDANKYYSILLDSYSLASPAYSITITNNDGATLPVTLSSFTAKTDKGKVTLRWRTETEVSNIGFNIYRGDKKDGKFVKLGFVKGAGNSAMPNEYKYVDKKAKPGQVYYYIEDIDVEGIKTKSPIVKSQVKKHLAVMWGKIKRGMR